jgi:hypothetical protein
MQMDSTAPWNAMQTRMDPYVRIGIAIGVEGWEATKVARRGGERYLRWWNGDVPQVIEAVGAATDGDLGRASEHPGYRPGE